MSDRNDIRTFGGPHRYHQGPGVLDHLGEHLAPFGKRPLLVVDTFVQEMLGGRLDRSCNAAGLAPLTRAFEGEITYDAVDELVASLPNALPGVVVGIGGGKALDAAKAVSLKLALPVVTVPTIASNDSPTSAAIAMYDADHVMVAVDRLPDSPAAVLVDTALIAAAPAAFLRAGIGDAISKKFEADACLAGTGLTLFGTRPLLTGAAIADHCFTTLRCHAVTALADCEAGRVTEALEATVEAVILMSGLGFENGGLSLAHSLTRGLVKQRGARDAIHGAQVAWGTLVQLMFEGGHDALLPGLLEFYAEAGLPTRLSDLGMADPTTEEIADITRWTMTAPHLPNLARKADEAGIAAAIHACEALSREKVPL